MLSLFKREPLLNEDSIEWLFDAFAWSLRSFGSDFFNQHAVAITPTPKHFPGRGTSTQAMAELIMNQVKAYSGVRHWPTQAVDHHQFNGDSDALASIHQVLPTTDGDRGTELAAAARPSLTLFYEPKQVGAPEVMIANFAHALMVHLASLSQLPLPCEEELLPHLTEVMAVTHGFGLMFANTATPYRGGGCGSCRSPAMERVGSLSEREVTYALAIFCTLKAVPEKLVTRHLKKSLRGFFKKALQDVENRNSTLTDLRAINTPSHIYQLD